MTTTNCENTEEYKPIQVRLREMPKDVRDIILDVQVNQKKKCNCQYSIEQTMYLIIRKAAKENALPETRQ